MFEQVKQEIDDKIKTNGNNEITANRLNGVLQDMMDASEEVIGEVLQSVGTQVEANPTGEATEMLGKLKIGETIYKTGNPFAGEVDATDVERLQALANVSNQEAEYDSSEPPVFTGKMGYKVLDPTKTFAEQVTAENTIYEIRDVFNLNNGSVAIPSGCTLKFNGGIIKNGIITFNGAKLDGNYKFESCEYNGSIIADKLDDRDFTSSNDKSTIKFLLENAIKLGVELSINRNYSLSLSGVLDDMYFIELSDIKSGAVINGNNHTITNTAEYTAADVDKAGFLCLTNVSDVKINDITFHDYLPRTTYVDEKSSGYAFVLCEGDCDSINFENCSQINGDSLIRSGSYFYNTSKVGHSGLTNSRITNCYAEQVGYGVAIYQGSNLNINMYVKDCGRGSYIAATDNSSIHIDCENPEVTGVCLMLTDGFSVGTENEKIIKGCKDLNIDINCCNKVVNGQYALTLSSYGTQDDFSDRETECVYENINLHVSQSNISESVERVRMVSFNGGSGNRKVLNFNIIDSCFDAGSVGVFAFDSDSKLTYFDIKLIGLFSTGNLKYRANLSGSGSGVIHINDSSINTLQGSALTGKGIVFCDKFDFTISGGHTGNDIVLISSEPSFNAGATNPNDFLYVGRTFFNINLGKMIVYNGSAWVNIDGVSLNQFQFTYPNFDVNKVSIPIKPNFFDANKSYYTRVMATQSGEKITGVSVKMVQNISGTDVSLDITELVFVYESNHKYGIIYIPSVVGDVSIEITTGTPTT